MARVIVFVRGREVTYVHGSRNAQAIYWDNLFEGICPVCEDRLVHKSKLNGMYCEDCNFDWENAAADEVIEHFRDP